MSKPRWKTRLEPFAQLYAEIVTGVEALDDEALADLALATERLTQTNCWWATYAVAPIVRDAAEAEIARRKYAALKAAGGQDE